MASKSRIDKLLIQTQHHDKDERFMATNDLITELEAVEGSFDAALQTPIRVAVLKQFEDSSTDVQTVAVKCLAMLVKKFSIEQVEDIVGKLGALVIDPEKKESRDIYSIGVKTIISSVADEKGEIIATKIAKALIGGLKPEQKDSEVELVSLEILKEVLTRFGLALSPAVHDDMLPAITRRLEHSGETVRKRAITTLGALVLVLSDRAFNSLMENIIARLEAVTTQHKSNLMYTYIQTIGVVSQAAGVRVGKFLPAIIPKLQGFCNIENATEKRDSESQETLIELWENCLQAFQAIITRCPQEVSRYLDSIVTIALAFVKYDPNYHYDDDHGDASHGSGGSGGKSDDWGDDDGWGDDKGDDDQTLQEDDDDSSWKVRRAAVRCLSAFIRARGDLLKVYFENLSDTLVARFKERDQTVKAAVMAAMCDLLQTSVISKKELDMATIASGSSSLAVPAIVRQRSSFDTMVAKTAAIIRESEKELKTGNIETKKSVFNVLRELIAVRRGGLEEFLPAIVPHVVDGAKTDNALLKSDALTLLRLIVETHESKAIQKFLPAMADTCIKAVSDTYLKIKAEALRTCGSIAATLSHDQAAIATALYAATFATLQQKDMDQDVKDASLATLAIILAHFGDLLQSHLAECFPLLLARLTNEITRLSALRAVTKIANSRLAIDLSPLIEPAIPTLCGFLRKDSQSLKHETVVTLEALVRNAGARFPVTLFAVLLREVTPHISDGDLQLSHLVLDLIASIIRAQPTLPVREIIDRVLIFIKSPLLQGAALTSVVKLFQQLLVTPSKDLSYTLLVDLLLSVVTPTISLQSGMVIAQCISTMAQNVPQAVALATVTRFATSVTDAKDDHVKQISLLVLGEFGRDRDLSEHKTISTVIFSAFGSGSEPVRNAAAFALGNISVGNMSVYLPMVLQLISSTSDTRRYLLLSSLKEIIVRHSATPAKATSFLPHVATVLPILFSHAESKEEAERTMVSECLGGLAVIDAPFIIPRLVDNVTSSSAFTRAVVITALRFALGPATTNLSLLTSSLPSFLTLLRDENLVVRRQCMLTVNALAHASPDVLAGPLLTTTILPVLYEGTRPDPKLIRVVDLGPFKHKIDDGLPLRKAAFQCLDTLLQVAPHRLNLREYMGHVRLGVADHDDIQIVTYQILHDLSVGHGATLLEQLDELPPVIMASVKEKLKEAKTDTGDGEQQTKNPERAKDVLRAAVRALYTMNAIPNVDQAPKFVEFYLRVLKTPLLAQLLKEMNL